MTSVCPIQLEMNGVATGNPAMDSLLSSVASASSAIADMHPDVAVAYCQMLGRVAAALTPVSEPASSGVLSESSVVSSVSSKRRRRASARVESLRRGDDLEPGTCYLRLVKLGHRCAARARLGIRPTLMSVLSCPVGWFISDSYLLQFSVLEVGKGEYHVALGSPGLPCGVAFSAVNAVVGFRPGEYGAQFVEPPVHGVRVVPAWVLGSPGSMLAEVRVACGGAVKTEGLIRDVSLVSRAASVHTIGVAEGLQSLQIIGGACIDLLLATREFECGATLQQFRELHSRVAADGFLSERFYQSQFFPSFECDDRYAAMESGVLAVALKALVGAVYRNCGIEAADEFLGVFRLE